MCHRKSSNKFGFSLGLHYLCIQDSFESLLRQQEMNDDKNDDEIKGNDPLEDNDINDTDAENQEDIEGQEDSEEQEGIEGQDDIEGQEDAEEQEDADEEDSELEEDEHSDYKPVNRFDASAVRHLSGMYQNWFLDYASYVILERAVPQIDDGLKPVQRRILHSMKRMDDGRFNKVANIVGHTMQFHPHGDASIGDALVQLGQKDLLIDTQGNWGNILTGDRAAAPRYIEAKLSKFALDTVFNPKTTE